MGLSAPWLGRLASGAPPTSYGAQVGKCPADRDLLISAIPGR